jgi:hypothetical protein
MYPWQGVMHMPNHSLRRIHVSGWKILGLKVSGEAFRDEKYTFEDERFQHESWIRGKRTSCDTRPIGLSTVIQSSFRLDEYKLSLWQLSMSYSLIYTQSLTWKVYRTPGILFIFVHIRQTLLIKLHFISETFPNNRGCSGRSEKAPGTVRVSFPRGGQWHFSF